MTLPLFPLLASVLLGCADRVRIEDEKSMNGVIQLKDWFTSFYVRPTDDGAVLFDGGFRAKAAERALDQQGIALSDVTDVFLTHGHGDHLGLLSELPASVTVHALPTERALIDEESEGEVTVDSELQDGQIVEVGVGVEVFAVPGHTDGSAVYLVDGVLILGDSAIVDRDGNLVPVSEDRSDDPQQLVDSMQALAEELSERSDAIDWLAPSHSAPLEGFAPLAGFPEG